MTDRTVSMIVQVGGAVHNQYLRALETAEARRKRLIGVLADIRKQLNAVAEAVFLTAFVIVTGPAAWPEFQKVHSIKS